MPEEPRLGGGVGPDSAAKLEKAAVNYRPARKERRCGNCVAFRPEARACEVVAGDVDPTMVCDRWVPLKRSHPIRA